MLRLAIDTGGTFTDFALFDASTGQSRFGKTLSTPDEPGRAVMEGIERLNAEQAFALADVDEVILATTVATNAVLERTGGPIGLLTTRGFRDLAIMGRGKRHDTYDILLQKPSPLISRQHILEITERMSADGEVITPIDIDELTIAASHFRAHGINSVAVVFLHSYANAAHELAVGEWFAEHAPDIDLSLSSDVSPRQREYERLSTTLANAYVRPTARRFLTTLADGLESKSFRGTLLVMQSDGGLISPEVAMRYPVRIVESGPAAGVLMCAQLGERRGLSRLLTFDMGGTTAKVGAVDDGEPAITTTFEVDRVNLRQWSGLPLNISAVELIEIGAGGGSIATTPMGLIQVGPQSAGADPGPACYGLGGTHATLTDANVALGYIEPDEFAGGQFTLHADRARAVIESTLCQALDVSVPSAAFGVHALANASMERALRSMSIERGRDPRDYTLIAFGGAGPLHASALARSLGIPRVLVPEGAGVGSAVGLLGATRRFTVSRTRRLTLSPDAVGEAAQLFASLQAQCLASMEERADRVHWQRAAYIAYRGQGFELRIELPGGAIDQSSVVTWCELFHQAYERTYGYAQADEPVEIADWVVTGEFEDHSPVDASVATPRQAKRSSDRTRLVHFSASASARRCPTYRREELPVERSIAGPIIVTDPETTVLVLPGDRVERDRTNDLLITVGSDDEPH
ncbi:MAG: hydantoinase/oxoprolinase family protein [Pseudomonadota bacterium]